jgi:DnaJ-class molecular chaperone
LRTLDGRAMNINIDKMITPQTVHVVPGEGMPKKSNTAQRGDMHIKFNITFPLNFKAEYKNAIVDILKKS